MAGVWPFPFHCGGGTGCAVTGWLGDVDSVLRRVYEITSDRVASSFARSPALQVTSGSPSTQFGSPVVSA
jgi:hypothetical protein